LEHQFAAGVGVVVDDTDDSPIGEARQPLLSLAERQCPRDHLREVVSRLDREKEMTS
jgi:hypothetical protein